MAWTWAARNEDAHGELEAKDRLPQGVPDPDLACRLAELDGVPPAEPPDSDATSTRVTELVADLVEPAKATALETLDEGRQALSTATVWLRAKFGLDTLERRQPSPDLHEAAHLAGSSLRPREPAMPSPETGAARPSVRLR